MKGRLVFFQKTTLPFFNKKDNKKIICLADLLSWSQFIEYWNSGKYPYPRWIDVYIDDSNFTRTIREFTIHVSNGAIKYVDRAYKFSNLYINPRNRVFDNKIGALDLKAFGSDGSGYGSQEVYAGGWGISGLYKSYFIGIKGISSSEAVITEMFKDIFQIDQVQGYTFYAHDLGRFDSIFLLRSLVNYGYKVQPVWKDNSIIRIKIKDENSGNTISLLDSLNLFDTARAV